MRGKSPVTSIDPQSVTLSKSLNPLCLSLWCSDMISMCTLSQGCCASYLMSACKMICRFEWQRLCNCTALLCCIIAGAAGSLWQALAASLLNNPWTNEHFSAGRKIQLPWSTSVDPPHFWAVHASLCKTRVEVCCWVPGRFSCCYLLTWKCYLGREKSVKVSNNLNSREKIPYFEYLPQDEELATGGISVPERECSPCALSGPYSPVLLSCPAGRSACG